MIHPPSRSCSWPISNAIADPGCGVDIPSFLYDLSFEPNKQYSKFLPKQPDILSYIKRVARKYDVDRHLQLSTSFDSAVWDHQAMRWVLRLRDLEREETYEYECKVLMVCVGNLADPNYVDIPGLEKFKGKVMHTGNWDKGVDLQDQRMAVIGNGPSATQLVPAVQHKVKSLHQFMRSPQHLFSCHNPSYNQTWQVLLQKTPLFYETARNSFFWFLEAAAMSVRRSGKINPAREFLRTQSLRHTEKYAPVQYLNMLTPSFDVGCKRRVLDNGYLKSLQRDHMHLTNEPISHIEEDGIVTESGNKIEVDIIVTATGFSNPQRKLDVTGREGLTLQNHWDRVGGLSAYQSIAVADFPNFFFVYGPNGTPGHSTALHFIEKYVHMFLFGIAIH
jgi:cation diffusion facilitator CzcD-associated flavoprotein CzcO